MLWDLFCRVIDNHGDLGVTWRLAADLAARGHSVRLWIDDARALEWMAPGGVAGVALRPWPALDTLFQPGDVVVEAFGCDLPEPFTAAIAAKPQPPVWINLEYLSAEDYVQRSHGLPSPQLAGAAAGLVKWFFYPGFSDHTGGLLREPDLLARQAQFDRAAWLAGRGWAPRPHEQVVSLFCYDNPALPRLLASRADRPTLLLSCPGPIQARIADLALPHGVRHIALPWLSQLDFDHLLWSADLNFVRGEDSLVRAMWAARPFVWQVYAQHDNVHATKLEALLDRFDGVAFDSRPGPWRGRWRAWNGLAAWPQQWPEARIWEQACARWRSAMGSRPDLCTELIRFVKERL